MREKRLLIVVLLAVMQSLGMCVLGVERGVEVSGKVVDGATGEGLEMVAVRLFSYGGTDSTLVGGCQTDVEGRFRLLNVGVGSYRLYVSSLGYKERILELRVGEKGKDIGVVKLDEEVEVLSEVVVSGHAAEMTVKGDTLEYNTAAYDVGEGAVVEDLLKKMSGVEVDKDGKVTVNGEQVTGIRVDGKKFFGDDVQSATKNIPADMIDKVQVIDEKSEMSKLTGFDDDDGERIINLKLKENKKKGLFGNFSLGAGADMVADNGKWFGYNKRFMSEDWRYNGGLFMNIMSGESQTTIIGGGNNTNELRTGRGRGGMSGVGRILEVVVRVETLHLTDSVEDNHVVVDGVTDDGQDGRDERLVNVEVERKDAGEDGEEADDDDGRVGQGNDSSKSPGPTLEPDGDVGEDHEQGQDDCDDGVAPDVARDGRADLVGRNDTVGVLEG